MNKSEIIDWLKMQWIINMPRWYEVVFALHTVALLCVCLHLIPPSITDGEIWKTTLQFCFSFIKYAFPYNVYKLFGWPVWLNCIWSSVVGIAMFLFLAQFQRCYSHE